MALRSTLHLDKNLRIRRTSLRSKISVTNNFLLKIFATPSRTVVLRPCEAAGIRFSPRIASGYGGSYNILKYRKGFTLFETLIVLAISGMIIAFGASISFDSYKGYVFRVERNVLVTVLERARSRAMNNYLDSPEGVCYIPPNYVIFQGTSCISGAASNELIPENVAVQISGMSSDTPIVFAQLTGDLVPQLASSTDELRITLTSAEHTAAVSINNGGRIDW